MCVCMHTHIYAYVCMLVCMHVQECVFVCVYVCACVCRCSCVTLKKEEFLNVFAKLRKATISFVMSVRPSVHMEQLGSHWTYFHEI
jgi:hypothetical protein